MTKVFVDPFKKAKEMEAEASKASASDEEAQKHSDVDLKELLGKTRTILQREIKNLMSLSSKGLLDRDSSYSLVNYIKLLKDLIKDEKALLDDMTDEELELILKDKK